MPIVSSEDFDTETGEEDGTILNSSSDVNSVVNEMGNSSDNIPPPPVPPLSTMSPRKLFCPKQRRVIVVILHHHGILMSMVTVMRAMTECHPHQIFHLLEDHPLVCHRRCYQQNKLFSTATIYIELYLK